MIIWHIKYFHLLRWIMQKICNNLRCLWSSKKVQEKMMSMSLFFMTRNKKQCSFHNFHLERSKSFLLPMDQNANSAASHLCPDPTWKSCQDFWGVRHIHAAVFSPLPSYFSCAVSCIIFLDHFCYRLSLKKHFFVSLCSFA